MNKTYKSKEDIYNNFLGIDKPNESLIEKLRGAEKVKEEFIEGEEVYVSDNSIEEALTFKDKRIFLGKFKDFYICVRGGYEDEYKNGEDYELEGWNFISKIPKEDIITITSNGQSISISKEKAISLGFNF